MASRISQKDVAARLGVSQQAVSFAINDRPGVNEQTRRRILRAAREMGYRPNGSARAIRQGAFGSIALLLSTDGGRSYLPSGLLNGIHDALVAGDMQLTVTKLPDDKLTDAGYVPRILRELSIDGLLINYTHEIPETMLKLIEGSDLPAIWLNNQRDHDCAYPDDLGMGREATEHLLGLGHRRIVYVDWGTPWSRLEEAHYSERERQEGYRRAMQDAGLEAHVVRRKRSGEKDEALEPLFRELLEADDRPTAVLGYASGEAVAALLAGRALGLRVPEDLSLMTFSIGPARVGYRVMTSVDMPEKRVGETAVQMLQTKLGEPRRKLQPKAVRSLGVIEGATAAPPS